MSPDALQDSERAIDTDPAADQRVAAQVAGAADLIDVRLLNAMVSLERLAPEGGLTWSLDMTPTVEHDEGDEHFVVRVEFDLKIVTAREDESTDAEPVASIKFELAALYELHSNEHPYAPTDLELEAYARTSATLSLYPYAREYVADATSRLGLPPLTLPVHRLPSPWHNESSLRDD